MASRPKRAKLLRTLGELAIDEIGPDATPLDWLCEQLRNGMLFSELAGDLADAMEESCSRSFLSLTAHQLHPEAKRLIEEARREGAIALGERAAEIADTSEATSGAAARARNSMSARFWLAERLDPSLAGKGATVKLDFGQLMLAALQAPPPAPPPLMAIPAQAWATGSAIVDEPVDNSSGT